LAASSRKGRGADDKRICRALPAACPKKARYPRSKFFSPGVARPPQSIIRHGAPVLTASIQARESRLSITLELGAPTSITAGTLGTDRILELTTVETAFTFWQYSSADNCQFIPDADNDSDDEILAFIDATNRFALWSDQGIAEDQGYWVSVAAEQGYPAVPKAHLGGLLRHDHEPTPLQMITAVAVPPAYDPAPMQDVADWVASEATNVVLVYGSRDPWSAGAFSVSGERGTSSHVVTGGNHLARVQSLPESEQDAIVTRLQAWIGR
jgi:hypothetical protein